MTQTYALRKTAFRSLALLGVLGLCTALAAWVSHYKSAPMNTAIDVLTEIRSEGLDSLWAAQPETTYTIYRKGQQHVGYLIQHRQRAEDGTFIGQDQQQLQMKDVRSKSSSKWSLDPQATAGEYEAASVVFVATSKGSGTKSMRMKMRLDEKKLTIARNDMPQAVAARVPDNYVPEGLWSAIQRRVAMQDSPARFAIVFDRYSITPQGQVQFVDVTLEPMGVQKGVRRMRLTDSASGPTGERVLEYDAKTGMLLREFHADGMIAETVTGEQFTQAYPQVTNP